MPAVGAFKRRVLFELLFGSDMLLHALSSLPNVSIVGILLSLLIAGAVKGTIGIGTPIVGVPLLSLFLDIPSTLMLLSVSLILTNIPQALEGGRTGEALWSLLPVIAGLVPGILIGARTIAYVDARTANGIAGSALLLISILMLSSPKFQMTPGSSRWIGFTAGFLGGILTGVAAIGAPLVFAYLIAKGLRAREFTKQASLFLVFSSGLLAIALTGARTFNTGDLLVSTAALIPVGIGMAFGRTIRDRIPPRVFKNIVLVAVMASGVDLLRRALFP